VVIVPGISGFGSNRHECLIKLAERHLRNHLELGTQANKSCGVARSQIRELMEDSIFEYHANIRTRTLNKIGEQVLARFDLTVHAIGGAFIHRVGHQRHRLRFFDQPTQIIDGEAIGQRVAKVLFCREFRGYLDDPQGDSANIL
jgi:hypothetical protein